MASKKGKQDIAGDREAKIKRDLERQNRDCGHSGPGPIYMLPPVLGYPNHDITRYRNPAFSVAGRPDGKKKSQASSGPIYNPGSYNRFGAKFSPSVKMTTAGKTTSRIKRDGGPGPNAYNYDDNLIRKAAPKVMIKGRLKSQVTSFGPGPGAYNPKLDLLYPTQPSATMTERPKYKFNSSGPGPGSYNPGYLGKTAPSATITGRREIKNKTAGPGPEYMPGYVGPSAPAFSIAGRPDPCIHPFIDKGVDDTGPYVPHPERIPIN